MGLVHHPNVVTDGLIGCWDAANKRSYPGAGSTLIDLAGSNSATLNYDTEFADVNGGAIYLDGTEDNVTVPIIDGQNGFSFSIWLYFVAIPTNNYTCFSIYNGGGAEFMFYIMETSAHTTSYMLGRRGAGTGNTLTSTNTAYQPSSNLDKWVHYCATYNGGGATTVGNYKVYFNGQVTDINLVENFGGGGNQDPMKWGQDASGAGDLDGYMGHVAFYNRPLSADEVSQNYESLKPRFEPRITTDGLFASWDAGDPNSYSGGTTLKDTANNYDGTFVNNGSGGDISFDSANGGSLVFDGSDDYVNITTLPNCSSLARSAIIWVAVDDWPTSDVPQTPFQSAADQFDISFGVTSSGIYFNGGGSTASTAQKYVTLSPVPADGAWICWAMTIDSSGDIVAMYRNGVALTASGTSAGFSIKNKTTIGCRINTDNTTIQNPLDGKVGSLRLYTKTLSSAEIMDNFQKTRGRFGV